ncbi:uncharacterized protein LOC117283334 [Fukomys damarensis]|uniref:uncharacterized protein LOC117283334 n=1 Tax=Fukomys damarensis TaxID=885580 RepID=UPI00145586F7|nr:uncharacterized protein LOC117283334 [Fukomys damarensis]
MERGLQSLLLRQSPAAAGAEHPALIAPSSRTGSHCAVRAGLELTMEATLASAPRAGTIGAHHPRREQNPTRDQGTKKQAGWQVGRARDNHPGSAGRTQAGDRAGGQGQPLLVPAWLPGQEEGRIQESQHTAEELSQSTDTKPRCGEQWARKDRHQPVLVQKQIPGPLLVAARACEPEAGGPAATRLRAKPVSTTLDLATSEKASPPPT